MLLPKLEGVLSLASKLWAPLALACGRREVGLERDLPSARRVRSPENVAAPIDQAVFLFEPIVLLLVDGREKPSLRSEQRQEVTRLLGVDCEIDEDHVVQRRVGGQLLDEAVITILLEDDAAGLGALADVLVPCEYS